MANPNIKEAQRRASSPEARAKAVATMKRRREEREAGLLAHAKITKAKKPRKVKGIPLDMIPDAPRKKKLTLKDVKWQKKAKEPTRQEVVLALLKYLNGG